MAAMRSSSADRLGAPPTAVVTGGNRGIGHAVADELARTGWFVVLVCRDPRRGEAARAGLAAVGGPGVDLVVGDLSTLSGIRSVAQALASTGAPVDVLVHNAGIWPNRLARGEDGLERAFVVNHLAPFLLNHALEPHLVAIGARVVQVSAGLYVKGRADPARTPTGMDFHPLRTYADTKLCNLLLLPLFAKRWENAGVTINAVHPGVVRTGLGDRPGVSGYLLKGVKRFWKPPQAGARPVVRLACASDLAGVTGRYFHVDRAMPLAPVARDAALARQLWAQARELTGVVESPPPDRPNVA